MDPSQKAVRILLSGTALPAIVFLLSCGSNSTPTAPQAPAPVPLTGFSITGDPSAAGGATWTYVATVSGTSYDLSGVLLKPAGDGPFPAVIISHGSGGSASGYSRTVAREMVTWGVVCIAANYTHAGGVPIGSPGTAAEPGASAANVLRARQLVEILRGLGYVDMTRVALHGHSMGAFVTAATAGARPGLFRAVSHTAGGIRPDALPGPAPVQAQVATITAPYQIHHGDRDVVVPLAADQYLSSVLAARGIVHELIVYPGAEHNDVSTDALVLERVRAWYSRHGLF